MTGRDRIGATLVGTVVLALAALLGAQGAAQQGRAPQAKGGQKPPAADQPQVRVSPDGKSDVLIQNYNIFVRPVGSAAVQPAAAQGPAPAGATAGWRSSSGSHRAPSASRLRPHRNCDRAT
jgi:hypothetical protein